MLFISHENEYTIKSKREKCCTHTNRADVALKKRFTQIGLEWSFQFRYGGLEMYAHLIFMYFLLELASLILKTHNA